MKKKKVNKQKLDQMHGALGDLLAGLNAFDEALQKAVKNKSKENSAEVVAIGDKLLEALSVPLKLNEDKETLPQYIEEGNKKNKSEK